MPANNDAKLTPDAAEKIRAACLRAALQAYEEGGISGLCHEGRWENVISAIQMLKLEDILALAPRSSAK